MINLNPFPLARAVPLSACVHAHMTISLLYEWQLALSPEDMHMLHRGTAESLYGKW